MVTETTVEAARLLAESPSGELVMTAQADVIARTDLGPAARTAELRGKNTNHGRAWTEQERRRLAELQRRGLDMRALMEAMGRTRGGIRSELVRQGLVQHRQSGKGADGIA